MWTPRPVVALVLCFLENLLFAGTIYGWPSLAYVYKEEGLFACEDIETGHVDNATVECPDQDRFLPLGLTVGLVGIGLGALLIGWMFDKYGLRITRTVTIVIGVSGSLCLAFANRTNPYLIFPGTFLTGAACISVTATNHHVALLAGKRAPMFNILYSGAINSGAIIYFLIKLAYDHGFSQRWSLLILSSLWSLVAMTTFLLLPKFKIQQIKKPDEAKILAANVGNGQLAGDYTNEGFEADQRKTPGRNVDNGQLVENHTNEGFQVDQRNMLCTVNGHGNLGANWTKDNLAVSHYEEAERKQVLQNGCILNESCDDHIRPKPSENQKNADIKPNTVDDTRKQDINADQSLHVKSLWYYMFSFGYIAHVVFLSLVHVWIGLVLGIMNTWLTSIFNGDISQVSYYTNVYAYITFICGFLIAPFAGGFTDGVRRCLGGESQDELTPAARAMVPVPGMIVSSLAAILVAVFMLLEESWSVYPMFIFICATRGFLYGNVIAYIHLVFPMEYFGMLHGVMFAVTGATLAPQHGYVRWVEAAGFTNMVSFQLVLIVLSLVHPGIITIWYLRGRPANVIYTTRL